MKNNYVLKKWYKNADHRKFTYPEDVDAELVPMLDVFNNLPGVRTCMSCCGHGVGRWYMSFYCASDFIANVILNYFSRSISVDEVDEWQKKVQTTITFEVELDNSMSTYSIIPEKLVMVHSDELGLMPENARRKEYKKICEFFAFFMPHSSWTKIHEF